MAKELAGRSVTVNAVAPGFIDTDMTARPARGGQGSHARPPSPWAGSARPKEVARAVAFFASEERGYITGQVLCVDGGMAM